MISTDIERRILISLRWLVTDAKHRFDECRRNEEEGSQGGYSPELSEAMAVLSQLERQAAFDATLFQGKGRDIAGFSYTETECKDQGLIIGMSEAESSEFFHHYNRQGWFLPTKLPITSLPSAMVEWRKNRHKHGDGALPEPQKDCLGVTPREADRARRGR